MFTRPAGLTLHGARRRDPMQVPVAEAAPQPLLIVALAEQVASRTQSRRRQAAAVAVQKPLAEAEALPPRSPRRQGLLARPPPKPVPGHPAERQQVAASSGEAAQRQPPPQPSASSAKVPEPCHAPAKVAKPSAPPAEVAKPSASSAKVPQPAAPPTEV